MKIELAKSLSGHDKNQMYFIWKKEDSFAWLVNGRTHGFEKPKKKNEKHYQIIKNLPEEIVERFKDVDYTNESIRRIIKEYQGSINK